MARPADDGQSLPSTLTTAEADQLAVCEAMVDEGLRTFMEVGKTLATINNVRLYRDTHSTFESYADERFGISRSYAHRMIGAARVMMSPIGDKITNEAQARELVPLLDGPDRLREVVDWAEAGGKITAKRLRAARTGDVWPNSLQQRQIHDHNRCPEKLRKWLPKTAQEAANEPVCLVGCRG